MVAEFYDPYAFASFTPAKDYAERLDADPDLFHVVCEQQRVGLTMFLRTLELDHFKPGTKDNDAYNMMMMHWQGLDWIVLSVPQRFEALVRQHADACGFRIADGVPHVMSLHGGTACFPMNSRRVWKLEWKENSIGYAGPSARETIADIAEKKIHEAERRYSMWYRQQRRFWFRGQLWIRCKCRQPPPDNAAMFTTLGESSGFPATWYTMTRVDPEWRPYPK